MESTADTLLCTCVHEIYFDNFMEIDCSKNNYLEYTSPQCVPIAMNMVVKPPFKRSSHKRSIPQSPAIELEKRYLLALQICTFSTYFFAEAM